MTVSIANFPLAVYKTVLSYLKTNMPEKTDGNIVISVKPQHSFDVKAKPVVTLIDADQVWDNKYLGRGMPVVSEEQFDEDDESTDMIIEYIGRRMRFNWTVAIHANSNHESAYLSGVIYDLLHKIHDNRAGLLVKDYSVDPVVDTRMQIEIDDIDMIQRTTSFNEGDKDFISFINFEFFVYFLQSETLGIITEIDQEIINEDLA